MEYNSGNSAKYQTGNPIKRVLVQKLNAKIIQSVAALLPNDGPASILDAGCGEGFVAALMADSFPKVQVTGLEYTSKALEIAKSMHPNATYIQGDVTKMPFEDKAFDIVVCTEVLEHLAHPEAALAEILRVAKHGVVLSVPDEPWFCLGNLASLKNITRLGNPPDHINHWTYRSFQRWVHQHANGAFKFDWSFPWSLAVLQV